MNADEEFDNRFRKVEESIDRYGTYLQNYLYSLTRNWFDAKVLTDDLFLYVLHKNYPEDKILSLRCLRRKGYCLFVDYWRSRRRSPVVNVEEVPDIQESPAVEPDYTPMEDREFREQFFSEYPVDLSKEEKEALWLHCRHSYTFKEIGKIMGKPPSTVGHWIARSRKVFAEFVNNE